MHRGKHGQLWRWIRTIGDASCDTMEWTVKHKMKLFNFPYLIFVRYWTVLFSTNAKTKINGQCRQQQRSVCTVDSSIKNTLPPRAFWYLPVAPSFRCRFKGSKCHVCLLCATPQHVIKPPLTWPFECRMWTWIEIFLQ